MRRNTLNFKLCHLPPSKKMKTILGSQQLFPLCPNAGQWPFQPITNHPSHESAASLHYPSHESTASLHSEPCCTIVRQTASMMTWPTRPHSYREPWIIEDTIFVNGHGTWQCHPTQKSTAPKIGPFPSFMVGVCHLGAPDRRLRSWEGLRLSL